MKKEKVSHPRGLYFLFVIEMWERFSYYGMRAIFVLYLTTALLFDKEFASQVYGSFTGMVYLTPLLGGYLADRYWGNRRSIFWGGALMAIGQFLLYFSALNFTDPFWGKYLMFFGLGIMVLGNGLFKPNCSTVVGKLYHQHDMRKDAAYTVYYMGINLGATLGPLICGGVWVVGTGNPVDFCWGFLASGIGMLFSIVVFELLKDKYLHSPEGEPVGLPPTKEESIVEEKSVGEGMSFGVGRLAFTILGLIALFLLFSFNYTGYQTEGYFAEADWIGSAIYSVSIMVPVFIITDPSLSRLERSRIWVIYIVSFFVIFFWAAFEQTGASLTFFANEQTDRLMMGWELPTPYLQSFNAIFIVVFSPLFASLWVWLSKRNLDPSAPVKQALGLFLLAMGYLVIALGVKGVEPGVKVSIMWLTSLYLIHTFGELSLSPIGLSLVNRMSPPRFASLLMGVWFLSTAVANKFAGRLSGFYPDGTTKHFLGYAIENLYDFFMLFVYMAGVAAVILFFLASWLNKMMTETKN